MTLSSNVAALPITVLFCLIIVVLTFSKAKLFVLDYDCYTSELEA